MFQAYEFEKVSAFYEQGRRNIEERLKRVLTLDAAVDILNNENLYGRYGAFNPNAPPNEVLTTYAKDLERLAKSISSGQITQGYEPRCWVYSKFSKKAPESGERREAFERYEAVCKKRFEDVDWMVLRDLQEGVVEHSFAPTDNLQRMLTRRDGRTYNLGDHVYRVRRTEEPTGVVAHLELPELKIEGEAKKPWVWDFIDRHERGVQAGIPLSVGIFGELMSLAFYLQLPENPHPVLYVAIGAAVAGSAFSIGTGIRILRHRS